MSELKVIVANVEGEKLVCTDNGDGTGTTVCRLSEVPAMQKGLEQLRKERDELKAFVKELSEEPVVTVTTPTGRFGGDEDTNYINDWWIDDAKDLLAKLNQQGERP